MTFTPEEGAQIFKRDDGSGAIASSQAWELLK